MLEHTLYNEISAPPTPQNHLPRPHIQALLQEAVQKPLVTVVAGTGYGKTEAVSAFLRDYAAITVWLQLSALDNLETRLWDHLVYAISLKNARMAQGLAALGFPDTILKYDNMLSIAAQEMQGADQYVLVLDDFHLIDEPKIIELVETIAHAQLAGLSLVLISRVEPRLNTVMLRSKGLLYTITEQDLRLEKEEMRQYLALQGVVLDEPYAGQLYEYADGWIFALYLLGLSLKSGAAQQTGVLTAVKLDIFRLIKTEVFAYLSPPLQRFLLKLSCLDELPFELLPQLAGADTALVEELLKTASFIRRDGFTNSFRIHHLFLEFLQAQQGQLTAEEIAEVHLQAARWYAGQGQKIDAIAHYEKVGRYEEILAIISGYSNRCPAEMADYILGVLTRMPPQFTEQNPIIEVFIAKFLLNNFHTEESYLRLLGLRQKYEALPPSPQNRAILGEVYVVLGLLTFNTAFEGRYDYQELFRLADEYLPAGSAIVDKNLHLNPFAFSCYVRQAQPGEFARFQDSIDYTMPFATRVMKGAGFGTEALTRAETALYQQDLSGAEKHAQQAIFKAQEQEQYDVENLAQFYLLRLHLAHGHYTKAMAVLARLKAQAERIHNAEALLALDVAEGWFFAQTGLPELAAEWITDEIESVKVTSPIVFGFDRLLRARIYLAGQRYYELLAYLEQQHMQNEVSSFLLGAIEVHLLRAVALYRMKEPEGAFEALLAAYRLAAGNQLDFPFSEQGNNMRALVKAAMDSPLCAEIPRAWLEKTHARASTYAKKLAKVAAEYNAAHNSGAPTQSLLSKREQEILQDLSIGLTREEIALEHGLSVATVKSIIKSVTIKLSAANTLDAVRIATEMKLGEK